MAKRKARKPKREKYTLKRDISIGGEKKKKGDEIPLTEQGAKYLKSIKAI